MEVVVAPRGGKYGVDDAKRWLEAKAKLRNAAAGLNKKRRNEITVLITRTPPLPEGSMTDKIQHLHNDIVPLINKYQEEKNVLLESSFWRPFQAPPEPRT
jgi:hypothetical protein